MVVSGGHDFKLMCIGGGLVCQTALATGRRGDRINSRRKHVFYGMRWGWWQRKMKQRIGRSVSGNSETDTGQEENGFGGGGKGRTSYVPTIVFWRNFKLASKLFCLPG